jgi:hypothetical protein
LSGHRNRSYLRWLAVAVVGLLCLGGCAKQGGAHAGCAAEESPGLSVTCAQEGSAVIVTVKENMPRRGRVRTNILSWDLRKKEAGHAEEVIETDATDDVPRPRHPVERTWRVNLSSHGGRVEVTAAAQGETANQMPFALRAEAAGNFTVPPRN